MGQNKDAAIGFGVIIVIIAIIVGVVAVLLPEDSDTADNELETNASEKAQANYKLLMEKIEEEKKNLQYLDKIKQSDPSELDFVDQHVLVNEEEYRKRSEQELERLLSLKQQDPELLSVKEIENRIPLIGEPTDKQKAEAKLSPEDLQTIIAGFESYNRSVKILLDMCVDVETEADVRQLGLLIAEHGDDFLEKSSEFGIIRNTLTAEGYGEHPVLGPLMSESENLVNRMSSCMEILAWEFDR